MSLSRNKIKYIRSLGEKKFRNEHNTFVAEGVKLVTDLLATCDCQLIAALPLTLLYHPKMKAEELFVTKETELQKATHLKTASEIIGVFYQPSHDIAQADFDNQLSIVLDGIQDPGNMGAIVRIADWFGIEQIVCSHNTVDIYNPKTVQATMGAIARVKIFYTNITIFLQEHSHLPIYGTFLEGENIYTTPLSDKGLIVMGSEGSGISKYAKELVNKKLFIPNFPAGRATSESLNVATATAITCGEFRRRVYT